MDFDLFDDDDDDLLTLVRVEPESEDLQTLITATPEFNCAGKDTSSLPLAEDGFVKSGFISNMALSDHSVSKISLSAYEFTAAHLHSPLNVEFLSGDACKHIQYLYTLVRCGNSLSSGYVSKRGEQLTCYQRRRQVTLHLLLLLHTTQSDDWRLIRPLQNSFRTLLNRISEPDTWKQIYFANSSEGNDCNVPAYQLLHGLLEWKFIDLCLLHKYELSSNFPADYNCHDENRQIEGVFKSQLERVVEDMILCTYYLYSKQRPLDLLHSSAFVCNCFKETWLLIQLILEKWNVPDKENGTLSFWPLYNDVVEKLRTKSDTFTLTPLTYFEFNNWLMNALTCLYGYRTNGQFDGAHCIRVSMQIAENYQQFESCTQQFLQHQPTEEQLRVYICLLTPTLLQWWRPNVSIPTLLWEHFHKRLNSSFYIAGDSPANLAVVCASGRAYVDRYRVLMQQTKPDANLSSFTLFALLLGRSMECLVQAQNSHQIAKLLGRIYTKFSLQKFLALNETGLHHLIELFLILLLGGNFAELAGTLRDKLCSIRLDKLTGPRQVAVIKGHMAIMLLYAEHRSNMSDYIAKLLQQLLEIRNDLAVSKVMADSLLDIVQLADDFARGEHLLIDAWLTNLLGNCTPSEQERTFESLHTIFVKMQSHEIFADAGCELMKRALYTHVLPYLKQEYTTNYSGWIPQLAADFCLANNVPADTQRLFMYFIEAQTANRQCVPQFLLKMLEAEQGSVAEPTVVMHVWLRSLVLLSAINEDVIKLTRHVVKLPVFQFMTALDAEEVLRSKEPLCVFIAAVGKQYDECAQYESRCQIVDNFNAYIRNFDRWLQPGSAKTSLITDKSDKNDVTFRFYSFIAIVIYNCPQIVYVKSKITCFFHVAITRFVLPTNVQMGKTPEGKLAHIIHKVWPVVVQGIGRLSFKTDPYIAKTLSDLIQKWTPHFKLSSDPKMVARPFVLCVRGDNHELSLVMFERLTSLFLSTQRRQADPNACLVITILQEIINAITADASTTVNSDCCERRLETMMKGCCLMMLEHIMMVDEVVASRNLLFEFFKLLTHCPVYRASLHLQDLLAEHLRIITKKHLAYYTFFYFDLVTKLAQISPDLVDRIMEFLTTEVLVVEQKRGAGEDNRIRTCLRKLQTTLTTARK